MQPGHGSSRQCFAFRDDVEAFIVDKIADNTLEAAFVGHVDEGNEKAIVWAYRKVGPDVKEIKAVMKRVGPNIDFDIVTEIFRTTD